MKWTKMGLIYCPDGRSSWAKHSALQPSPYLINEDVIRIYAGFRDDNGISRVGFVDVDAHNPSNIIRVSENPLLDIGLPGTFDENGVVPTYVLRYHKQLLLYYAGYQLGQKTKFYAFAGVAISNDDGFSFVRHSRVPIMDRTNEELYFRVIHCIIPARHGWHIWYGAGDSFINEGVKIIPSYNIRYMHSKDHLNIQGNGGICIDFKNPDEYRLGRPCVIRAGDSYRMFYATQSRGKKFRIGYAESNDAIHWVRKDEKIGIDVSDHGWDSDMISYPAVIKMRDKVLMFYNGNDMGKTGFGYAIMEEY